MNDLEKLTILIDPVTGDYQLSIDYCEISHIKAVCLDIIERIDKGELHRPELLVDTTESDDDEDEPSRKSGNILDFIN